jgi:hypothetical protein
MIITITSKKYGKVEALMDQEDYEKFKEYPMYVWGSKRHTGLYLMGYSPSNWENAHRIHRLIMDAQSGEIVDHINGNPLDNRRNNRRIVTSLVNNQKARKRKDGKTSQYKGVSFNKNSQKWVAQIQVNKKKIGLGYFTTPEEAAIAYNLAIDYYGTFSPKNAVILK